MYWSSLSKDRGLYIGCSGVPCMYCSCCAACIGTGSGPPPWEKLKEGSDCWTPPADTK